MIVPVTNAKGVVLEILPERWRVLPPKQKKLYKLKAHGYYVHMNEDAEAHAIIGGNRQGKSSLIADILTEYDKRFHKVIVLNASEPQAFGSYRFVDDINKLKTDWRGIIRFHNDTGYKQILKDIYQLVTDGYIYNGAIVFDDCTKYIDPWPSEQIRSFLVDRRMYGMDLYFTTHMLRILPKFCRGMVNTVTTFKTAEVFESPNDIKALDYANHMALYKVWKEVMATPHNDKSYIQKNLSIETGI